MQAPADAGAADAPPDAAAPLPECNPLATEWDCMLPFPSDAWRVDGKILLSDKALPHMVDNGPAIDMFASHPTDGASVLPQIAVRIPGGVTPTDLVPFPLQISPMLSLDDSLLPANKTLILDAETGKFVVHFAEIDPRPKLPDDRALVIRPLTRLQNNHRYIVALSASMRHLDGSAIAPPAHFLALRDQPSAPLADRQHYESGIFPQLEKAGVPRKDLLLAWDFTTESEPMVSGDLLAVREKGLAAMAALPVAVTLLSVETDVDVNIARRIEGQLTVPLFLDKAEPGGVLLRKSGQIQQNGTAQVPFTILIPPSVLTQAKPARVVQFGHGFFMTRHEMDGGGAFEPKFANENGIILIGVDWWGMSTPDVGGLVEKIVTDTRHAMGFVDRVHQGMLNQLAVGEALHGALATTKDLQGVDGKPLFDANQLYFYGISLGHILGTTFVTLSPRIDRAVFGSGGAGFGLMMSRANPFDAFLQFIDGSTGDALATLKATLLMQTVLDRIDPATYLPHLLADTLPGCPQQRHILQHTGISDTQVPNIASHVMARSLGLPLLSPTVRAVWGLVQKPAPLDSAIVEFDFHQPLPDLLPVPVQGGNLVHGAVREAAASKDQVNQFLRVDGKIVQTCDGACDPQ